MNKTATDQIILTDPEGKPRAKLFADRSGAVILQALEADGSPGRSVNLLDPGRASVFPRPGSAPGKESIHDWHKRMAEEVAQSRAKLRVGAYKLYIDFMEGNPQATAKYMNEVIEVSGEVVDVAFRDFGDIHVGLKGISGFSPEVICHFFENMANKVSEFKPGQRIKLKGKCTEYVNKRVKLWGCCPA